ncbi:ArnT family glycosyltransferase [Propionicicella superfundia]|uniref:ArnT family glycosyltransferase n=1 Tax=Propionicicella superfundia TaxID=348582 RepID=UPI000688DF93|nr:glycosyltransferase family 39 protein [Propionicicella superfundia]
MTASVIDPPARPTAPIAEPAPARRRRDWLRAGTYAALLVGTAVLYLWGLDQNGYANSFYSAAAQAGSQDWVAWFFGSSDAGNSITVDKPPASLWLMGLSVRIFGLSSWSILVPQALLGVGSVAVLYASVRRTVLRGWPALERVAPRSDPARFAHWTALAAGAALALTPVATLMFRFNNPDALLVFLLTLSSYFTLRATENGSRRWLLAAGVAIGFGFLTKMLQAFLILPILVLVYIVATKATWKRKLVDLLIAFAAVVVSSGWYVAVVELTPASLRPYIGGSQNNSILELIIGYNGLGRITGDEVGSVGGGNQAGPGTGTGGLLRMFTDVSGGMVSWLIPAALVLGIVALVLLGRRLKGMEDDRAAGYRLLRGGVALWLGWLVITAAVFSFMSGIYHDYYTVALAPAIGGTLALGGGVVWAHRQGWVARIALAAAAIGSAIWAVVLLQQAGGLYAMLGWGVLAVGLVAGAALVLAHRLPRILASAALVAALAAGLAGPTAYSIQTAATAHTGSIVTAGPVTSSGGGFGGGRGGMGQGGPGGTSQQAPGGQGGPGGTGNLPQGGFPGTSNSGQTTGTSQQAPTGQDGMSTGGGMGGLLNGTDASSELVALLSENADGFTWVAATTGSQNAASYQLASGYAVMPIGGFNGSDPSPTLEQFTQYVAEGKIHYYIAGSIGGQQNGGSDAASEIATWVEENFTAQTVGTTTVYDLTESE